MLLHTKVMRKHLLTAERLRKGHSGRPGSSARAEVFVAKVDNRRLNRTLTACGYRRDQLGADLRRRLHA